MMRRLIYTLEVRWARRWFGRMTLRQATIIAEVTGAPIGTVLQLHPSLRTREDLERISV